MSKDFIPRNDADFNAFFKNIFEYVCEKAEKTPKVWTHIPTKDLDLLLVTWEKWEEAYLPTLVPHAPEITKQKNRVRKTTERFLRDFINRFLRHEPVLDIDRDFMRIRNPKDFRTNHIIVTEEVEFVIEISGVRQIHVKFWVRGQTNLAKPDGYDGAVLVWDVLDTPPERPESLNRHTLASRTPHTIEFDETERGKTVYVAMCWQNERAKKGPWSVIKSAVIP